MEKIRNHYSYNQLRNAQSITGHSKTDHTHCAFTIIETALFLGLSGLLLIALTANHSRSIAIQRYEDSVDSLASFLKNVYASFLNPENQNFSGMNRKGCTSKVGSTTTTTTAPGTSDCAIYGKLIVFGSEVQSGDEPNTIYSFDVVGDIIDHDHAYKGATNDGPLTQLKNVNADYRALEEIGASTICTPAGSMMKYSTEWGANLQYGDSDYKGMILVTRSPVDGTITTYVRDNGKSGRLDGTSTTIELFGGNIGDTTCKSDGEEGFQLKTALDGNYVQEDASFCIKSSDLFVNNYSQSITIKQNGQDPSAIVTNKSEDAGGDCQ